VPVYIGTTAYAIIPAYRADKSIDWRYLVGIDGRRYEVESALYGAVCPLLRVSRCNTPLASQSPRTVLTQYYKYHNQTYL